MRAALDGVSRTKERPIDLTTSRPFPCEAFRSQLMRCEYARLPLMCHRRRCSMEANERNPGVSHRARVAVVVGGSLLCRFPRLELSIE